jgi:hypothetical protein
MTYYDGRRTTLPGDAEGTLAGPIHRPWTPALPAGSASRAPDGAGAARARAPGRLLALARVVLLDPPRPSAPAIGSAADPAFLAERFRIFDAQRGEQARQRWIMRGHRPARD